MSRRWLLCFVGFLALGASLTFAAGTSNTAEGSLGVELIAKSGETRYAPDEAIVDFGTLILRAGNRDATVSKLHLRKYGLSTPEDLSWIRLVDQTGAIQAVGEVNADHRTILSLNITVPAGTEKRYHLEAMIEDGTGSSQTIQLGIEDAGRITSTEEVTGEFPLKGDFVVVVRIPIGSLLLSEDGITLDQIPEVGERVILNQFTVTASSVESAAHLSIGAIIIGSAPTAALENLMLKDVLTGYSYQPVPGWKETRTAWWALSDMRIERDMTRRFRIEADIVGGYGLTLNTDIIDGTQHLVRAVGETYEFLLPIHSGDWGGSNNGQGANYQTIQTGAVFYGFQKSQSEVLSPGTDQELGVLNIRVWGEGVAFSDIPFKLRLMGMQCSEIKSIRLIAEKNELVAGPKDCSKGGEVSFAGSILFPRGERTLSVVANIADTVSPGDAVQLEVGPAVINGLETRQAISPSIDIPVTRQKLVGSFPRFSVNSASPSGDLIASSSTLLAVFNVEAVGKDPVTFLGDSGNSIRVMVSQLVQDADGEENLLVIKDKRGNILDSVRIPLESTSSFLIQFVQGTLVVPAGTTEQLYIYANTTEFEDDGDVIQLWLDDDNPENINWGIDGSGNYSRADIIFRGDVFANALFKQEQHQLTPV